MLVRGRLQPNQRSRSTLPRRPQAVDGHLIEHRWQAGQQQPALEASETT